MMQSSTQARSSKPQSGAEVAGLELVGGMNLGRGRGRCRRMEHGRDGRHESESELMARWKGLRWSREDEFGRQSCDGGGGSGEEERRRWQRWWLYRG
jgi:hypothetical protein